MVPARPLFVVGIVTVSITAMIVVGATLLFTMRRNISYKLGTPTAAPGVRTPSTFSIKTTTTTIAATFTPMFRTMTTTTSTVVTNNVTTNSTNTQIITTYGSLVNNGTDDNDPGYVCFDTEAVRPLNGTILSSYVQEVTLNFSVAPSTSSPRIWLYAINATSSSNVYTVNRIYQLPYSMITTNIIGNQTFILPPHALPLWPGQYLAIGFANGGGSCYRVYGRNQYYMSTSRFSSLSTGTFSYFDSSLSYSFKVLSVTTQ